MWAEWVERFDRLCSHSDPRIKRIGEMGRERAKTQRDSAAAGEREEAVRGRR